MAHEHYIVQLSAEVAHLKSSTSELPWEIFIFIYRFFSMLKWLCPCKTSLKVEKDLFSCNFPLCSLVIKIKKWQKMQSLIWNCRSLTAVWHQTRNCVSCCSLSTSRVISCMKGKKTLQRQIFYGSSLKQTLTLVSLLQIAVSCAHWALGCYQGDQLCKSSAKHITLHSQYFQCGLGQGAHQSFDASDLSLHREDFKFPFAFHCPLSSLSITQGA